MPSGQTTYTVADEHGLMLVGYIAFLDPPKESAAAAIRVLQEHGVAVKILTGDNEVVTRHICRKVGLPVEQVMLGSEIEAMSDPELAEARRACRRIRQACHRSRRRASSRRCTCAGTSSASWATASTTVRP